MSLFVTYVIFYARKKKVNSIFCEIFLLVLVIHISIFDIFIFLKRLCNLLDEVSSDEIFNVKFILEVIIPRQQHKNL